MSHPAISGVPAGPIAVPDAVAKIAGDDTITPVWENEVGGLTFRLDDGHGTTRYAKWAAAGTPEIDLAAEAERLAWARPWVRVPGVLDHGADDAGSWLVTSAVPGRSAVDPRWLTDPTTAATAIGHGLRILHDTLPADACPFDWSVERRLALARERRLARARARHATRAGAATGESPSDRFDQRRHPDITDPEAHVNNPPPVDRLVVCHGDACAPNTLLHDDGTFAAHVDFGSLGLADRWADLAIAAWSTEWNYGPGFDTVVYDAYGIDPDPVRIAYYRLLWDMT